MSFMTEFRKSVETQISFTNNKIDNLDKKQELINSEMKTLTVRVDKMEEKSVDILARMDARLDQLEQELKSSEKRADDRETLLEREMEKVNSERLECHNLSKQNHKSKQNVNEITTNEDSNSEHAPAFQSMWAKKMQEELDCHGQEESHLRKKTRGGTPRTNLQSHYHR